MIPFVTNYWSLHCHYLKCVGYSYILNYSFADNDLKSGTQYYRLTQIDYNGQSETFDIVSVFNPLVDTEGYHRIIVYNTSGLIVTELLNISELKTLERNKLYILKFINKYTSRSTKYILR